MPGVSATQPYRPGKPLEELEREYGITDSIKLASNESPLGPSPAAVAAARDALGSLRLYPDSNGFELKRKLSGKLGVSPEQLTLGNGSNDVLDLVVRCFAGAGHEIIVAEYGFIMFQLMAQAAGATPVVVPSKAWGADLDGMLRAVTPRTRVVFLANPNNPTGTWCDRTAVLQFLRALPSDVVLVLDEAYFEYVTEPDYPDGVGWLSEFPNLIVTRTFSKAYGLAGLRIGYGVSSVAIADLMNRIRQPFNVNTPAQAAAVAALDDVSHLQRAVEMNRAGLAQLDRGLGQLGLGFIPSAGNFLTVEFGDSVEIYQQLLHAGVIVRPLANYGMPDHLRISVGTEAENSRCLQALEQLLAG
ncbi:MAG: histidinol-phosphate transaminase [Gammaproteobacteria bacterium]|nr:histidinol-phosphate transaminase [Gammaproteobacteria bacterium]